MDIYDFDPYDTNQDLGAGTPILEDAFDFDPYDEPQASAEKVVSEPEDVEVSDLDISALLGPHQLWAPEEYAAAGVHGGSARKLSGSFVAPLITAARGYKSFDASTRVEAFKAIDTGGVKQRRTLSNALDDGDVLMMPWHSIDPDDAVSVQFRPDVIRDPENEPKYQFVGGSATPLAIHPATPRKWLQDSPVVFIVEGLLKGDAALTGWLIDRGVPREALGYTGGDAQQILEGILARIPADEAVSIVSIAGCHNYRQNPEWSMLRLKGREAWIGIDGDLATKRAVWDAAKGLHDLLEKKLNGSKRKGKRPRVLVLPAHNVVHGETVREERLGVDDYLAGHGSWADMVGLLEDAMPERPARLGASIRVEADMCSISEYRDHEDPARAGWHVAVPIGGRVVRKVDTRTPTDAERATGRLGEGVPTGVSDRATIEIEVATMTPDGQKVTGVITGPMAILDYHPEQWDRQGAVIPAIIRGSSNWPPRGPAGLTFVSGIKLSYYDAPSVVRWEAMGYVPTASGVPDFIVGSQVVGSDESLSGLTGDLLDSCERFGLRGDHGAAYDDPGFQAEIKDAIETYLDYAIIRQPWADQRYAAAAIAAGIRPAIPMPNSAVLYCSGPPNSGKTFSSEVAAGFWQAYPGSLTKPLGSAEDSPTFVELSMSRSLLWLHDDVAPSASKVKADNDAARAGTIVRFKFNGTAPGRATADRKIRSRNTPAALLILTAENELRAPSERQRALVCHYRKGVLNPSREPTDAILALLRRGDHQHSLAPNRIILGLIARFRHEVAKRGWAQVQQEIRENISKASSRATQSMGGEASATRHDDKAADFNIGLGYLRVMAREVGCEDWVLDAISRLQDGIIALAEDGRVASIASSPGQSLIEALRGALSRGRAFVAHAEDSGRPPSDQPQVNQALGWSRTPGGNHGEWQHRNTGDQIGWLMYDEGEPFVMFDSRAAFNVAKFVYPDLILDGQTQASSWSSATSEGLGLRRLLAGSRTVNTARKFVGGVRRSGYPVPLASLFPDMAAGPPD
ncbi:MAG: hypothetical protein ACRCYU_23480 [Nocardioides sp.]